MRTAPQRGFSRANRRIRLAARVRYAVARAYVDSSRSNSGVRPSDASGRRCPAGRARGEYATVSTRERRLTRRRDPRCAAEIWLVVKRRPRAAGGGPDSPSSDRRGSAACGELDQAGDGHTAASTPLRSPSITCSKPVISMRIEFFRSTGARLLRTTAPAFHRRAGDAIPEALVPALLPVLDMVGELTARIATATPA
jgi:hypothetical protein